MKIPYRGLVQGHWFIHKAKVGHWNVTYIPGNEDRFGFGCSVWTYEEAIAEFIKRSREHVEDRGKELLREYQGVSS